MVLSKIFLVTETSLEAHAQEVADLLVKFKLSQQPILVLFTKDMLLAKIGFTPVSHLAKEMAMFINWKKRFEKKENNNPLGAASFLGGS